MRLIISISLFILIPITISCSNWEIISKIDTNTIPFQAQNDASKRSLTLPIVIEDTLYGIANNGIVTYKNKKWSYINLDTLIFNKISDETIKNKIQNSKKFLSIFKIDRNNNIWLLVSISIFEDILIKYENDEVTVYSEIKNSATNEQIRIEKVSSLNFDNNNVPYIIVKNPNKADWFYVCKFINDRFTSINSHTYSSPGLSFSYAKKGLFFDSKNNYWEIVSDSLYYYENDKVIKRFCIAEFPKESNISSGVFTNICIDNNDKVYVVSNIFGIYVYEDNVWKLEKYPNERLIASNQQFEQEQDFTRFGLDSYGNLYINPAYYLDLFKMDTQGRWISIVLPNAEPFKNSVRLINKQLIIDSNNRIWFFTEAYMPYCALIYSIE